MLEGRESTEPTPEEIERAVRWMIREALPDLREIAGRRWGAVTIILQDGKPHIKRDKTYDRQTDIYGGEDVTLIP